MLEISLVGRLREAFLVFCCFCRALCIKLCESIFLCLYTVGKIILSAKQRNKPHLDTKISSQARSSEVKKLAFFAVKFFLLCYKSHYLCYLTLFEIIYFYFSIKYKLWGKKDVHFRPLGLIVFLLWIFLKNFTSWPK